MVRSWWERLLGRENEKYVKRWVFGVCIPTFVLAWVFALAAKPEGLNGRFNIFFSLPSENPGLYLVGNTLMVVSMVAFVALFVVAVAREPRRRRGEFDDDDGHGGGAP